MGRGPKPAKGKAKPAVASKSPKDEGARVRDLEKRLADALKREAEALEQQTAASDILSVISRSPTDVQPVFDAVAESAARLCEAQDASIFRRAGDQLLFAAHHGPIPFGRVGEYSMPLVRETLNGRCVLEGRTMHVADLQIEEAEFPQGSALARRWGYRTVLNVPLMRDRVAIGSISLRRTEVKAFTERQIALLQTFADQAVIAIENVRLFTELQARNSDLTEALDQQTATAEVLKVISRSTFDLRPVLEILIENATRLCGAQQGFLFTSDGELHRLAVEYNAPPAFKEWVHSHPSRTADASVVGRVAREGHLIQILDAQADTGWTARNAGAPGLSDVRTLLGVPMRREGVLIGVIAMWRTAVRPYTDKELQLVETFADQAVIAIENVRLFKELQEKNLALTEAHAQVTEALEQQTATAEILRVISRSQTDVQPVFDTIVRSAVTLCDGLFSALFQFDGELLHRVAQHNFTPEALEASDRVFPARPTRALGAGRAILERAVVHIPDVEVDPEFRHQVLTRAIGFRSGLFVPMLREGAPIGVILVARAKAGPFSNNEIELLKTFADQAVIAIENVRLFNETKEALEQQTATSEILQVISSSPTNVQPVFHAIARSAVRLCDALDANVFRRDGDNLHVVAHYGSDDGLVVPALGQLTIAVVRTTVNGRCVIEAQPVHVEDLQTAEAEFPEGSALARRHGQHTQLSVPLLKDGRAIGTIAVRRAEVRLFTDKQVGLLQTFADQAVIAIENVRLFTELQEKNKALTAAHAQVTEALDRQTATSEILRVISGSPTDVQPVFDAIIKSAVTLCNGVFGSLDRFDGDLIYPVATHNYTPEALDAVHRMFPARPSRSMGVGRAILNRDVVHIPDVELDPEYKVQNLAGTIGFRSGLFVPMLRDGVPIGVILVGRSEPGPFSDNQIALLKTFADQAVIAIENVRLFKELEAANRDLAAASQHKSEFLANMSHELRTPLNAIIGFSEVLTDRMFGELNEKQDEYLKDIYASGTHLLSLINDILDLSKIEAGRMELELTDFDLPTALDNALMLVRERAGRRSIALHTSIDGRLGEVRADERKIRQVVLNLLSNAIKFTPEGGRIEVNAAPRDGSVEVSVSDTGVGIAPEDQEAVFEEFRQAGTAEKKAEGTGLGLTLCRKFIELHGGRIWVKSQVGSGSTFTFTIPARHGE